MNRGTSRRAGAIVAAAIGLLASGLARAGGAATQGGGCHLVPSDAGPPRQILRCAGGPSIEAEEQAGVHVRDLAGLGHPDGVVLDTGAALIDVPPGYRGGFQILAPRAIASVRGTAWIVDAGPDETAVFVIRGRVEVRRPGGSTAIVLRAREGVDVRDDGRPLRATRWPAQRASALLARFGRR